MARRKDSSMPWAWADEYNGEITQENYYTAYRLNLKQHKPNTCRKNCRTNPSCLSGFGEGQWLHPIEKEAQLFSQQRTPGSYVGLKNLGNTCYISSLLQLWFHNLSLREAIYQWNALEDKYEQGKHKETDGSEISEEKYYPLSSLAHLQYLFAEMEFGLQKYCNPEAFCKSLSIDVELQQDAQEFSKLYMHRLEEAFVTAKNEKIRNVIQTQFRGDYSYETTCSNCKTVSRRSSYFYELELNVKGCKTIIDSLDEFVREESLAGDNKYLCSVCDAKQEASTCIRLQSLPPVLQLQLIRYCFDMTTATKKKITQPIQFPDLLDMSPYLGQPPGESVYSLHAVLMHGGSSAHSGHYYAHIKTLEGWHVFDDTTVKKQKQLSLVNDDPVKSTTEKKSKEPKLKGFRSSSSAYMLVYTKSDVPMPSALDSSINEESDIRSSSPRKRLKCNQAVNVLHEKIRDMNFGVNGKNTNEIDKFFSNVIEMVNQNGKKEELICIDLEDDEDSEKDIAKAEVIVNGVIDDPVFTDLKTNEARSVKDEDSDIPKLDSPAPKPVHLSLDVREEKEVETIEIHEEMIVENSNEHSQGNENSQAVKSPDKDTPPPHIVLNELSQNHWKFMPYYLQNHVLKLNNEFMNSCQFEIDGIEAKCLHQEFVNEFVKELLPSTNGSNEFIHYEVLTNLTRFPEVPPSLNNTPLLCQHGKLDVEKVKDFKLVSSAAVDLYVKKYGGEPRIKQDDFCCDCVSKRASEVRARTVLMADVKQVSTLLKTTVAEDQPSVWVGRKSLRNWWAKVNKADGESLVDEMTESGCEDVLPPDGENEVTIFNSDISCPHDDLCIEENDRRLVSKLCLDILLKYFPKMKLFDRDHQPCLLCQGDAHRGKETENQLRETALAEKSQLAELFNEKREIPDMSTDCFLVSSSFVGQWRRYVRSAGLQMLRGKPTTESVLEPLLCPSHSLLLFDPNVDTDRFCVLSATEWETIKTIYHVAHEISVKKTEDGTINASLGLCGDCISDRIHKDQNQFLEDSYVGARIYVYKVSNEVVEEDVSSPTENDGTKSSNSRKRRNDMYPPYMPSAKKVATDLVRRSARSRRPKGERQVFLIDKHTTLKDLKIMIFSKLDVMPSDQHLFLDGENLDDLIQSRGLSSLEATLLQLGVPPNSVLRLLADEPSEDHELLAESGVFEPETGFKGTELTGR